MVVRLELHVDVYRESTYTYTCLYALQVVLRLCLSIYLD